MKSSWIHVLPAMTTAGLCLALVAPSNRLSSVYERTDLLSDGAVSTPNIDPNLVNPWGLASSPSGPFWIANEGTGTASIVHPDGSPFAADVAVPGDQSGHPTGLVFNGGGGFEIQPGGTSASSLFLFVTEEGRVLGWNPDVDPGAAVVAVDNQGSGAAYTGAAIASSGAHRFLYVANFGGGTVDVFDQAFVPVGSFANHKAPENYAPFGIAAIHERLLVTYALRDPDTGEDVPGPGNGFVYVLSADGVFDALVSRGELDAPWGMALTPGGFGQFSHKLLVGNFGDGRILAYNLRNGHFFGALEDEEGEPIAIPGLWSLKFGNGGAGGDPEDLYFTAGIEDEQHGLFGEIELAKH